MIRSGQEICCPVETILCPDSFMEMQELCRRSLRQYRVGVCVMPISLKEKTAPEKRRLHGCLLLLFCVPGAGDRPCGACPACYKTQRLVHPDLHIYEDDSKNKVDTVRRIKESVYTLPNDGDYKVYLICRAEELTIEAQNALLKILEEPPEDTVFLLTCRSRAALANTVVSRCVPVGLTAVTAEECAAALCGKGGCAA